MRILFDLDGTLTDSFLGITNCIQYALEALGRKSPPAEELRWCIGPPLQESFLQLLDTEDRRLGAEAMAFYRERYGSKGLFENKVYQGIVPALDCLKEAGYEMSVATSKPEVFAIQIIEHFGLGHYFSSVDGSQLDGTRTDKSALIKYILERDGLMNEEAIMVGDREHDVIGGSKNDLVTVGVLWGNGSREELLAAGTKILVASPGQIPQAIKQAEQASGSQRDLMA